MFMRKRSANCAPLSVMSSPGRKHVMYEKVSRALKVALCGTLVNTSCHLANKSLHLTCPVLAIQVAVIKSIKTCSRPTRTNRFDERLYPQYVPVTTDTLGAYISILSRHDTLPQDDLCVLCRVLLTDKMASSKTVLVLHSMSVPTGISGNCFPSRSRAVPKPTSSSSTPCFNSH